MSQEPLDNAGIQRFWKANGLTYPVFAKVDVNGDNAHPLFAWLKSAQHGLLVDAIKWNFTKFLVVNGKPVKRYGPLEAPMSIEDDIVEALVESAKGTEIW